MSQPSQHIAARFQLQLSQAWQRWFDDHEQLVMPGDFDRPLAIPELTAAAPQAIWAGFMLPDTLPLVGNAYGDWICARVTGDGDLGELIHWYHGGGDWIPLGDDMAEVIVHDVVDYFRPIGRQMLRGAPESAEPKQQESVLADFGNSALRDWLVARLSGLGDRQLDSDKSQLDSASRATMGRLVVIEQLLAVGDYVAALRQLQACQWSPDAVACDLIQVSLQPAVAVLADPAIARAVGTAWSSNYKQWLFDGAQVPEGVRELIATVSGFAACLWDGQDWEEAAALSQAVLSRRYDLGWAVNVAAWSRQRIADEAGAAQIYFHGRQASAFSDQGVRMRTHWCDARHGKFTIAQLSHLHQHLRPEQQHDSYLQCFQQETEQRSVRQVQQFWFQAGQDCLTRNEFAQAYDCFYRSGWDVGVRSLNDYRAILQALATSARQAGWPARAAVAETHFRCLPQR